MIVAYGLVWRPVRSQPRSVAAGPDADAPQDGPELPTWPGPHRCQGESPAGARDCGESCRSWSADAGHWRGRHRRARARHDPARVLREVAAKRAILDYDVEPRMAFEPATHSAPRRRGRNRQSPQSADCDCIYRARPRRRLERPPGLRSVLGAVSDKRRPLSAACAFLALKRGVHVPPGLLSADRPRDGFASR
jgi:hypothetical protein